jgi:ATP-dependent RNA helicase RhlE
VHRIGRTGRAGLEGEAVSLVCVDEHKLLRDIEKLLRREIPKVTIEGYEPDPAIRAEPIKNGRNGGGGGRSQARNTSARRKRVKPAVRHPTGNVASKPKHWSSRSGGGRSRAV